MSPRPEPFPELSESERKRLLELARAAVGLAAREGRRFHPPPETGANLVNPRAVFVSLHKKGHLRGCIGQVAARLPLYRAVPEVAYSAALEDPRFEPLAPEELPQVSIEVSVLSDFFPIRPEEVRVGTHGLMILREGARGLLLPQVAAQYRWDAQRFLEECCVKAGLEPDAWNRGAQILAFTAQVFGEGEEGPR